MGHVAIDAKGASSRRAVGEDGVQVGVKEDVTFGGTRLILAKKALANQWIRNDVS